MISFAAREDITMISMRSKTSDGSSYQVMKGDNLIGLIHRKKDLTSDKYLASIYRPGEKEGTGRQFDCPQDAIDWIGKNYGQAR